MKKIAIIATILLSSQVHAAKSDLKSQIMDKVRETAQEETVSGATSESLGFLKGLVHRAKSNAVRFQFNANDTRVYFAGDSEDKITIRVPRKGTFNVPASLQAMTLPTNSVYVYFDNPNGPNHPYRIEYFPKRSGYMFTINKTPIVKQSHVDKKRFPLIVNTYPLDAKVRILNIVPKYQRGMLLPPKNYRIEVTHKGYKRMVYNKRFNANNNVFHIELQRL